MINYVQWYAKSDDVWSTIRVTTRIIRRLAHVKQQSDLMLRLNSFIWINNYLLSWRDRISTSQVYALHVIQKLQSLCARIIVEFVLVRLTIFIGDICDGYWRAVRRSVWIWTLDDLSFKVFLAEVLEETASLLLAAICRWVAKLICSVTADIVLVRCYRYGYSLLLGSNKSLR